MGESRKRCRRSNGPETLRHQDYTANIDSGEGLRPTEGERFFLISQVTGQRGKIDFVWELMLKKTALYDKHLAQNAKMVDFAGFSLPINYGSQIEEHKAVRADSGMFDVSHMVVSDISGPEAKDYLGFLLANDVAKLSTEGKALYSCMLRDDGGIIDDLILYWLHEDKFRIVSNGATRDKDIAWMQKIIKNFSASLVEREDLGILAVQGPKARDKVLKILPDNKKAQELARFYGAMVGDIFIGRTGYTGEDGFEIIAGKHQINNIWDQLLEQNVIPCGLGARDSLRLEAGMMLYGTDMDESNNPFESGLKWTVNLNDREFCGSKALKKILEQGVTYKMVGLILKDKGIMRHGQEVYVDGRKVGSVTSGGFSPTLQKSIAFARVHIDTGNTCQIKIRNKFLAAEVGGLNFIKPT